MAGKYTTSVMLKKFKNEERAKVSLEHAVYAAGILLALVFIFSMYSSYLGAVESCRDHPGCPS